MLDLEFGESAGMGEERTVMREGRRVKVRVERVDTKCGSVGHMTVDEIRERTIGDQVNVTCPECGQIHLTQEDVEEAETQKITLSPEYLRLKAKAQEDAC